VVRVVHKSLAFTHTRLLYGARTNSLSAMPSQTCPSGITRQSLGNQRTLGCVDMHGIGSCVPSLKPSTSVKLALHQSASRCRASHVCLPQDAPRGAPVASLDGLWRRRVLPLPPPGRSRRSGRCTGFPCTRKGPPNGGGPGKSMSGNAPTIAPGGPGSQRRGS
jgi:hypothetical protein